MPRKAVKSIEPFALELNPPEPTDAELLVRALMRKAEAARGSLEEFYRLVMRHETTHELLDPAPHQCLMFSFVEHHDRCVFRQPVGTGKTFGMAAVTLWLLGRDRTARGACVSKTANQAGKVLSMVGDYIADPKLNGRLGLVFPYLKRSPRPNDPWSQKAIVVDRPAGIRDPSLAAAGFETTITGSRLSWLVGDDIIDDENTFSKQSRDVVASRFDGRLMSRLDPLGSRAVVTNTPWHREDLTYHLENNAGWPTITMDIYGFIKISNPDASWLAEAERKYLRPSKARPGWYRLKAHDPDPNEETPLWPERYPAEVIKRIRYGASGKGGMLPNEFARSFLCEPFDAEAARCQREWIEKCKQRGMGLTLVDKYDGPNPTFTGVDLGIGQGQSHDRTVYFTFELHDDGSRRLLDIESGRFDGRVIVDKLIGKADAYHSVVVVENNAAQDFIRQWAKDKRADLAVRAHTTTRANKANIDFGVESIFNELQNGAWIIPCDANGQCAPEVQAWIDAMLYYQPPPAHTPDHLVACWIARERARKSGSSDPKYAPGRRFSIDLNPGGF